MAGLMTLPVGHMSGYLSHLDLVWSLHGDLVAHSQTFNIGYQFLDEEDKNSRIGLPAVTFLSDLGRNTPNLLTKDLRPGERCVHVRPILRVI